MVITCRVKPGARQDRLEKITDTEWKVSLKAPPVDGKANEALIVFLAETLGLRRSKIVIKSGFTSRLKRIEIDLD